MGAAENIDLIRGWIRMADEGFTGDFGKFFTPDYKGHVSGRMHMDLPQLERLERGFAAAFADTRRTIEDIWGADDKVVLRLTTRMKHVGQFNGIEATGRVVIMTALVIYQFRDGRISESWGELDFAGLWQQLRGPSNAGV